MDNIIAKFLSAERRTRNGASEGILDWYKSGNLEWFNSFFRNGSSEEKLNSVTGDLWDLLQMQRSIWGESHVLNALPEKLTDVGDIIRSGGTGKQHLKNSVRDLVWLEEHGQCLDNIRDGISTNPDAGRGAFANRFIPEGGLVGPAPLIHVPNKAMLKMYEGKYSPNGEVPDLDGPTTNQLILNYCFTHEDSTLLLCPYGLLTSLINHSRYKANAKIVWSKVRHVSWQRDLLTEAWLWKPFKSNRLQFSFFFARMMLSIDSRFQEGDTSSMREKPWQQC